MRSFLIRVLLATAALAGGPASANTCRTDSGKICPTGMPVEGYCECAGQGGTVVTSAPRQAPRHAPDCRATPEAPGCPHQ